MIKIMLDMDGVVVDWLGPACQLMDIDENDCKYRDFIKQGGWFEDLLKEDFKQKVVNEKSDFFKKLPKLSWADDLYNELKKLGDVCFLTSPGNVNNNRKYVSYAAQGKVIWLSENYPNCEFLIGRAKHFVASSSSILIDDMHKNIKQFFDWNGNVFHWPCQYSIIDGEISLDETLNNVKSVIKEIKNAKSTK